MKVDSLGSMKRETQELNMCRCKCVCLCSCLATSSSLQCYELWPARLLSPWDSPGKNTEVGVASLPPEDLTYPGNEPTFPTLQAGSLPIEPWGNPADISGEVYLITLLLNLMFIPRSVKKS